jgi:hypothetical protein
MLPTPGDGISCVIDDFIFETEKNKDLHPLIQKAI